MRIYVWLNCWHVLLPEPIHFWRVDDTRVFVLLIAPVLVFVSWEEIWVTYYWYVQDLSDDTGLLLVACH